MSRFLTTLLGFALLSLATGCCCGGGGGYGACRPNACAAYAPAGGPVASAGCSSCGY
jgi:hypothetical protein